jgi:hypothetical protein
MKPIDLLNKLYELQYSKNTFKEKNHEKSVKKIIESYGLKETKNNDEIIILQNKNNINKSVDELVGRFIFLEQPFGSQQSPDFIVCINGFIIWIECKSGKNKITWNSGYPRKDILYVFTCKKNNATTIFLGSQTKMYQDFPDFEEKLEFFDKEVKKLAKEIYKKEFKDDKFYEIYIRKMLVDKTKYSDQNLRKKMYEETLNFYLNFK